MSCIPHPWPDTTALAVRVLLEEPRSSLAADRAAGALDFPACHAVPAALAARPAAIAAAAADQIGPRNFTAPT